MKSKIFSGLKYFAFFLAGFGILLYLIGDMGSQRTDPPNQQAWFNSISIGFEKIIEDFSRTNYLWISISLIIALLSHVFRALRWNLLIEPLGYKPKAIITFFAIMNMYLFNLLVPRMGEVTRCGILKKYEKIPVTKLIGTMIVERAVDFVFLFLFVAITLVLQFDIIFDFLKSAAAQKLTGDNESLGNLAVIIILVLIIGLAIVIYLLFNIKKSRYFYKIKRIFAGLRSGFKSVRQMKNNQLFILHSSLIWICYFLMIYVCFFAFKPTENLSLIAGISLLTIGSFGMIAPVQGGIGAYHWCVQTGLIAYGVSSMDSLSFAFIVHTSQTVLIIIVGVISLILLPIFAKKRVNGLHGTNQG